MRLTSLPSALRAAGLTVHEYSGWRTRGSESWGPIRGITCHHTAGSRTSSDAGELGVLVNGSSSAPPPIAQLYLSRSGEWWVVASGKCFHNLTGWGGPNSGLGNSNLIGIEAQHSGGTEPWTDRQYRSYVTGVAALCRHLDVLPSRVAGHKEHQPGAKSDPTFNMDRFRTDVRAALEGDMPLTDAEMTELAEAASVATWGRQFREYADEHADGEKNFRTASDMLWATHRGVINLVKDQAARDAAEQARDAALAELVRSLAALSGSPLTEEQLQVLREEMRAAAEVAGQAATARLEAKLDAQRLALADAARAEADRLAQ